MNTRKPTTLYEKLKIEKFWTILNKFSWFYSFYNFTFAFFADINKLFENTPAFCQMLTPILMADTVYNHQEITLEEKKTMYTILSHIGKAHELPKTYKDYKYFPYFCPIIDTTNTLF